MSVEYRKNRKRWGYRFYLRGKCFTRYVWETKTEAKAAERVARTEAEKAPILQPTAMITASGAFLIASAERQRSAWRLESLRCNFKAYIVPFFGEATLITDITPKMVENFIVFLKQTGQRRFPDRKLKNKTIFNVITDLRAMFYWAMEEDIGLCSRNPVTAKVSKMIGSTKSVKAPFNPRWFDIAATSIEDKRDRAWFDVTRYLGMRLDEANRLQWSDINW